MEKGNPATEKSVKGTMDFKGTLRDLKKKIKKNLKGK